MTDKSEIEAIRAVKRYKAKWSDIGMSSSDDVTLIEARDYDRLLAHVDALEARIAQLEGALRWAVGTEDLRDWAIYASKEVAVTIEGIANDIARAALAAAKDKP